MDLWTFLWLMLFLKLPIAGLLGLVWWAIRQKPPDEVPVSVTAEPHRPKPRHPHRRSPLPRHPRRGPHGGLVAPAPARMRTVTARVRRVEH